MLRELSDRHAEEWLEEALLGKINLTTFPPRKPIVDLEPN